MVELKEMELRLYNQGKEAGKQEVIERLKKWVKGELDTHKRNWPWSDWDDQSQIFSLDDLMTELEIIENL